MRVKTGLLVLVCLVVFGMGSFANGTDLKIMDFTATTTKLLENKPFNISYSIIAAGNVHACINMAVDINKGNRNTRFKKWGLPSNLCDRLKNNQSVSQTLQINLPEWGKGTYLITLTADEGGFLNETSLENNKKSIKVIRGVTNIKPPAQRLRKPMRRMQLPTRNLNEEIYVIDQRESPGKIFQLVDVNWRDTPVLRPVYERGAGFYITALAFHKYGPAYFVDFSRGDIFKSDGREETNVFAYTGRIQDLAFDSRGRFFASVPPTADQDGKIYRVNHHSDQMRTFITIPVPTAGNGYWNGFFAFDSNDKVYVSIDDPSQSGGGIYEYAAGEFNKVYAHDEPITGFTFADDQTLYFTTQSNKVFELNDFQNPTVKFERDGNHAFYDVVVAMVPKTGSCGVVGKLSGGRELWPMTRVQAYGPNVIWRRQEGTSQQPDQDGRYQIDNLPNGRYWVRADIGADTMAGFDPQWHTINCAETKENIDFNYSR
jgi:hypothetical protein